MPPEQSLNAARTKTELCSKLVLGRTSFEASDNHAYVLITQSVAHPPDAGRPAHDRAFVRFVLTLALSDRFQMGLRQPFLQVGAVRVTSDKLHAKHLIRGQFPEPGNRPVVFGAQLSAGTAACQRRM